MLQSGPIARSAEVVAAYAAKARESGAGLPQVVATSAARDARNQKELTSAIEVACGLPVRVITGEEEAMYAFQGVTSDPSFAQEPLLLIDVGGGSTEFILGQGDRTRLALSFHLGTVRLLHQLELTDPPQAEQLIACRTIVSQFLQTQVGPQLLPVLSEYAKHFPGSVVQLVGTGGTASFLGAMEAGLTSFDRERLEAARISLERLCWHVDHLWSLPLAERRKIPGLPANRADVILTGAAIYESIMVYFSFEQLRVSTRGLRFALLLEQS
jgi:exopolyphosphatase/guanosine-5'-triphosphate,3'-diphosphate pyrophosphatase